MNKRAEKPENRGGRPAKPIDIDNLEKLAAMQCTLDEIAAFFDVAPSTLDKRLAEQPECRAAVDRGREVGKTSIRREQFKIMQSGNASMAIFLGKQYLGQRDQATFQHTGSEGKPLMDLLTARALLHSVPDDQTT